MADRKEVLPQEVWNTLYEVIRTESHCKSELFLAIGLNGLHCLRPLAARENCNEPAEKVE
ncbi:MAG TPA: hypothetical protein DCR17_13850 [Verrucomicrobiales bacterium]|nr:hypothetical protein [Pedosphaera sp.]HAO67758.1 hypothetical protein [Verrucomicrobiales bacterium]